MNKTNIGYSKIIESSYTKQKAFQEGKDNKEKNSWKNQRQKNREQKRNWLSNDY